MPVYGAGSKYLGRAEKETEWRRFHAPQAPGNSHCAPAAPGNSHWRSTAQLIRRVYEIDPLVCPRCRGVMRVVAFITESRVIRRILEHLGASARRATQDRALPPAAAAVPVSP